MVQFLSIYFFFCISSIFVGVFKSSRFFVSPCLFGIPRDGLPKRTDQEVDETRETTQKTYRRVRPERANQWPKSMLAR